MNTVRTFLRVRSVRSAMGWANSTLYQKIKEGLFVPPVKLGARSSAWPSDELAAVQDAYLAGRPQDDIRRIVASLVASRANTR